MKSMHARNLIGKNEVLRNYESFKNIFSDYRFTLQEVALMLSLLSDRRDATLRKLDNLRKMEGSIDEDLSKYLSKQHHEELELIRIITEHFKQ